MMEGLTAYVASERYIHVSSLTIPYNNANVATLELNIKCKSCQFIFHGIKLVRIYAKESRKVLRKVLFQDWQALYI
jgi:hypothetical protein